MVELVSAELPLMKQQAFRDRTDTSDCLCSLSSRASCAAKREESADRLLRRLEVTKSKLQESSEGDDKGLSLCEVQSDTSAATSVATSAAAASGASGAESDPSPSAASTEGADAGQQSTLSSEGVVMPEPALSWTFDVDEYDPLCGPQLAHGNSPFERLRSWTMQDDDQFHCELEDANADCSPSLTYALSPGASPMFRPCAALPNVPYPVLDAADIHGARRTSMTQVPEMSAVDNWKASPFERLRSWTVEDDDQFHCDFEDMNAGYSPSLSCALSPDASPLVRPRTALQNVAPPVLDAADVQGERGLSMSQVPEMTTVETWEARAGPPGVLRGPPPCAPGPPQAPEGFAIARGFGAPHAELCGAGIGAGSSAGSAAGDESTQAQAGPSNNSADSWPDGGGYMPMRLGSAEWPTLGSMAHYYGTCRPCAFRAKGCTNGMHCPFCHLCDLKEKDRRQKTKGALYRHLHQQRKDMRKAAQSSRCWDS